MADDRFEGWHLSITRDRERYRVVITAPDGEKKESVLKEESLDKIEGMMKSDFLLWISRGAIRLR